MDLPSLKHHRGIVKGSITKTFNYIQSVDKSKVAVSVLKNRRLLSEQHFKRFEELQQSIEELVKDDNAELLQQITERDEVEGKYVEAVSLIDSMIEELTPQPQATQPPSHSTHACSGHSTVASIKLPAIDLPKFSGRYEDWTPFMDLFESTIDKNPHLTDVQRLQFLRTYVVDQAAAVIKNLPISSSNYSEAWTLLKTRYNNEREIVYSQVRRLFNIPSVKTCTANSIQQLLDSTKECIRALTSLKQPTEHWDTLIVHMTIDRLDSETKKQWALQLEGTNLPTYSKLCDFLEQYIRGLHACASTGKSSFSNDKKTAITHHSSTNQSTTNCVLCKSGHPLFKCSKFISMTVKDRVDCVKENSLCFNCLRPNHKTVDCRSNSKCRVCNKQHNSLLHFNRSDTTVTKPGTSSSSKDEATSLSHHSQTKETDVLLCTAVVNTHNCRGESVSLRILLDGGSQGTLISKRCAKALGLKRVKDRTYIEGTVLAQVGHSMGKITCRLYSNTSDEYIDISAMIMENVTRPLPNFPMHNNWEHLKGLKLADPNYFQEGPIDILLGQEYTMDVTLDGSIKGNGIMPSARNTIFGWVVGGRVQVNQRETVLIHSVQCAPSATTDMIVKRFWEIEEVPQPKHLTAEERQCDEHFVKTHKRDVSGRFCVELPLNDNISKLGFSRDIAIRRLKQVEKRLARFPEYREQYNKAMQEAVQLKHMVRVPRGEATEILGVTNYLCHHFVLKPDSTTTRLRVVMDASAKTTTGVSLNDCLLVGPTIQNDIFTLLLKFRLHQVAIKADIEEMFKQFGISEKHANLQRVVWREHPSDEIQDFKLVTITFGTGSAPFQATRCLQQLAEENKDKYPLAAKKLEDEIYMDDLIGSCQNREEAIRVIKQLIEVASSAGLIFRKWSSNDSKVIETVPEELRESTTISFDKEVNLKALGVMWNQTTDNFCFGKLQFDKGERLTKRKVLSQLARVFDPLGFVSPVTVSAKIFMQTLWKDSLQWDDKLSDTLCSIWKNYCANLEDIDSISIRRWIQSESTKTIQLHSFCDSSERAYGNVIYLRCEHYDGTFSSYMVAAKSRVAPTKNITLPRLELCAAVLLSQMVCSVKKALNINCETFAWTDSMIVLQWLASYPGRWMTFVANRVSAIQDVVPFDCWNHVRSEENPADIVSRGISAAELATSKLWWEGPSWLSSPQLPPKVAISEKSRKNLEERKNPIVIMAHVNIDTSFIDNYSSLFKLKRVVAFILRFVENCRRVKGARCHGPLTVQEHVKALEAIVRAVQRTFFPFELELLSRGKQLPKSNKLLCLNPFLDSDGTMKVGGRLQRSNLPVNQKHGIILPSDAHFTKLLILDAHYGHLHGGAKLVLSFLQAKYWIVNAKNTIRYIIRKCVICRRHKAEQMTQLMGSLPSSRVTQPSRPFVHAGCDYAGPFHLKVMKDGRGKKTFKGYFCIFVCMATKAVHLEPVSDMSTEAFIESLKRFVSRRGVPAVIYSDCGSNFVGADRELQQVVKDENRNSTICEELSQRGIEWKFNPPSATHHGGLWEAGVKSVKYHLRRSVGQQTLTFEEFATLLCQVEACLNSRPLTASSSDPNDLEALTPGHFLVGHALTALPQRDVTDIKMNRLTRWEYTQQHFQQFWKRWRIEYLSTLQQRYKWKCKRESLSIGDLVIIHEDNVPPMKWRMGRVMSLETGNDGLVRVVQVKTSSGVMKRPIVKLTPLLFNDEQ